MGLVAVKAPSKRRPGPYKPERTCPCGAQLSRLNPGPLCAPCNGGAWLAPRYTDRQVRGDRAELLEELMGQAA